MYHLGSVSNRGLFHFLLMLPFLSLIAPVLIFLTHFSRIHFLSNGFERRGDVSRPPLFNRLNYAYYKLQMGVVLYTQVGRL